MPSFEPSGVTAMVGCHWSVVVVSSLTLTGLLQVAPPSVDCLKKTSALSEPAPLLS